MAFVDYAAEDVTRLLPPHNDHPTFLTLIPDTYTSWMATRASRLTPSGQWKNGYLVELFHHFNMTAFEAQLVILVAVLLTLARYWITKFIAFPLANWLKLSNLNRRKFPESFWKFFFYLFSWSYCYHVVFHAGYSIFTDSKTCFQNYDPQALPKVDILMVYLIQGSFYIHSLYATLYMDERRKDTWMMILHHILTDTLIGFSHAFRYHNAGVLIIFTHDVTDICLEFAKLMQYLKLRDGKIHQLFEYLSNFGFVIFAITWVVFRLYWFPLKALHTVGHSAAYFAPTAPCMPTFVVLLWILFTMNVYWFSFIFTKFIGVVFKNEREIRDTREDEGEEILDLQEHVKDAKKFPKEKTATNNNSNHTSKKDSVRRRH
ncbi:uncharacterized protein TRIADDRAFT_58575 [Trichoplax adhaerens]|uniref:TLC domain-containing protein n=1 Tax=Trichoplax adhaerens TaxID=10228 RepID=B3S330_TRIAD|nr:hypothetical protein TRIADDRAFT_58575 [Trichoplax adhaerens]EDV22723.1 hypothetical protein TRIADDRAFT_58575 [Trichoplax adhaerens]|eukprot:XP_002114589.1 hypothetical protein TRIADDRAFT_58575 [Trichoplax adhaerens]